MSSDKNFRRLLLLRGRGKMIRIRANKLSRDEFPALTINLFVNILFDYFNSFPNLGQTMLIAQ